MATSHSPLPLELLFPRLEAAGFALNTARRLRVWRVLNTEGKRFAGDMEGLKFLLCPLLAQTPQEQQRFYVIFEQFWAECVKEWEEWPAEEETESILEPVNEVTVAQDSSIKWERHIRKSLVVIILGIIFYFTWKKIVQDEIRAPVANFELINSSYNRQLNNIRSGDTIQIINTSNYYDSTKVQWEIRDFSTNKLLHFDSSLHLTWVAPSAGKKIVITLIVPSKPAAALPKDTNLWPDTLFSTVQREYTIQCMYAPIAGWVSSKDSGYVINKEYQFEVESEKGCSTEWSIHRKFSSNDSASSKIYIQRNGNEKRLNKIGIEYIFENAGRYELSARVFRADKKDYCYTEITKNITVGSNKPYLSFIELKYHYPRNILQISWHGWLMVFFPILPGLWFLYLWLKKRNATPVEKINFEILPEYHTIDAPPYYIPYLPQEEKITVPHEFFRISDVLRRRENDERREFDVYDSIKSTIAAGGFPIWRDQAKTRPADSPITTYFHDGRFDRFWNENEDHNIDLQQLNRKFPQHRLIILGDGHSLVQSGTLVLPRLLQIPLKTLLRWPRRLLLTPEDVSGWSYQEILLHSLFPIFPADTDGILQGLETLDKEEEYIPGLFEKWKVEQQSRRPEITARYRNMGDIESLREFLSYDSDLWRWFHALAVCSHPDWALTIAIGRAIGVDVTHDRLLALTRVEWLRRNEFDNHLRFELLKTLDPIDERNARQAIVVELNLVEERVKNGFVSTEWAANLAVQRFALNPHYKFNKVAIQNLKRMGFLSGDQLKEIELIIDRKKTISPNFKGDKLDAYLKEAVEKPLQIWEMDASFCLFLASLVLFIYASRFNIENHVAPLDIANIQAWQMTKSIEDKASQLNNKAVQIGQRISLEKSYTMWLSYEKYGQQADTFWRNSIDLRKDKGGYPLADSNSFAFHYNIGVKKFNFFSSDSINVDYLTDVTSIFQRLIGDTSELLRINEGKRFSNPEQKTKNKKDSLTVLDGYRINTLHSLGICNFFQGDTSLSLAKYHLLLRCAPTYFDTLSIPINLQTLLTDAKKITKLQYQLRVLILNKINNKPIVGANLISGNLPVLRTDKLGQSFFSLTSNPLTNKNWIKIEADGYLPRSENVLFRTSEVVDTIYLFLPNSGFESKDRDADGIADDADLCPTKKGTLQYNGCPPPSLFIDADSDGIADNNDSCPQSPGPTSTNGCPDFDSDGVSDLNDNCPFLFNSNQLDLNNNGIGDACEPQYELLQKSYIIRLTITDLTTFREIQKLYPMYNIEAFRDKDNRYWVCIFAQSPENLNEIASALRKRNDDLKAHGLAPTFFNLSTISSGKIAREKGSDIWFSKD